MYDISNAVEHYTRTLESGVKQSDKHMDGFLTLLKNEFSNMEIKEKHKAILNGGILNKRWDLLVNDKNREFAFEFKSILSSRFGRNYNSRVEEAVGVGFDAKDKNKKVKLGYLIVLENDDNNSSKFYKKIDKFCDCIVNDYKIYQSALAIEITNNKWKYLYSDYNIFIKNFYKKTLLEYFFKV